MKFWVDFPRREASILRTCGKRLFRRIRYKCDYHNFAKGETIKHKNNVVL